MMWLDYDVTPQLTGLKDFRDSSVRMMEHQQLAFPRCDPAIARTCVMGLPPASDFHLSLFDYGGSDDRH